MSPLNNLASRPIRILCVDPSASHLAFAVSEIDPGNTLTLKEAGIVWTTDKWSHGQRFTYMYNSLEFLIKEFNVEAVYTEAFFSSPKMRMGTHIIPTINNFMQMIIYKLDKNISYEEISPTAWRKPLGIKPDIQNGKKDFKAPTKRKVEEMLSKLPEELLSNITGNLRSLPTDVPDAIAINLYVGIEHGVKTFATDTNICYNKYSDKLKGLIDVK